MARTSPTGRKTPRCRRIAIRNRWPWRNAARCWPRRRNAAKADSAVAGAAPPRPQRPHPPRVAPERRQLAHRRQQRAMPQALRARRPAPLPHAAAVRRPTPAGWKALTQPPPGMRNPPRKEPTDRPRTAADVALPPPKRRHPQKARRSRARRPAKHRRRARGADELARATSDTPGSAQSPAVLSQAQGRGGAFRRSIASLRRAGGHGWTPRACAKQGLRSAMGGSSAHHQGLWTTSPTWIVSEAPTISPKLRF